MTEKHLSQTAMRAGITAMFIFCAVVAAPVSARESHFRPILADVLGTSAGPERVAVEKDGSLRVYGFDGRLLHVAPQVGAIVTNPISDDFAGDETDDLAYAVRGIGGEYSVTVYDLSVSRMYTAILPSGSVYFDPIAVETSAERQSLLVATESGAVYEYGVSGEALSGGLAFNAEGPVALAVGGDGTRVVATYPISAKMDIYAYSGGLWSVERTIELPAPAMYAATIASNGVAFLVTADPSLVMADVESGEIRGTLPLAMFPADSPQFGEVDTGIPGLELSFEGSDGKLHVFNDEGQEIAMKKSRVQLRGGDLYGMDGISRRLFRLGFPGAVRQETPFDKPLVSQISRSRIALPATPDAYVVVTKDGGPVLSGSEIAVQTVFVGYTATIEFTLENRSWQDAMLVGEPTVALMQEEAGQFSVSKQASGYVPAGKRTTFIIAFHPTSAGEKTARIDIATSNPDTPAFSMMLRGSGAGPLLSPTDVAVLPEDGAISLSWRAPATSGMSALSDYIIEYSRRGDPDVITLDDGVATAASARIAGLVNGETYTISVRAVNAGGEVSAPASVTAVPRLPPVVYEDGDAGISRWSVSGYQGTGSPLEAYTDAEKGSAIRFANDAGFAQYTLLANGGDWANETHEYLSWDMKTAGVARFDVRVVTSRGMKIVSYGNAYQEFGVDGDTLRLPLSAEMYDGAWHTITRDIANDIAALLPETSLVRVDGFSVEGAGLIIDSVQMLDVWDSGTVFGFVKDISGSPIRDARMTLLPQGIADMTDASGYYAFPSLSPGAYTVRAEKAGYAFAEPDVSVTLAENARADFSADLSDVFPIENAEDGDTVGWQVITDACGQGAASVQNSVEGGAYGNVIATCGENTDPVYRYQPAFGTTWGDIRHQTLSLDMKTSGRGIFYAIVKTDTGLQAIRYVEYMPDLASSAKELIHLGSELAGSWRRIERNLPDDLAALYPGKQYLGVDHILVRGGMRLDNILLKSTDDLHVIRGRVADSDGRGIPEARVELIGGGATIVAYADASGSYVISGVSNQSYTLSARVNGHIFNPVSLSAVSDDMTMDFIEGDMPTLTLEDGEDGDTNGWRVVTDSCGGGENAVLNKADGPSGSYVQTCGINTDPVYEYYGDANTLWGDDRHKTLSWDMKASGPFVLYAIVDTNTGLQAIRYVGALPDLPSSATELLHLQNDMLDGTWRHVSRNLRDDLEALYPGREYWGLKRISVRGGIGIDNLVLLDDDAHAVLSGTVFGSDGMPAANAKLEIRSADGAIAYGEYSNADGSYVLPSLPAGDYAIAVQSAGGVYDDVTVADLTEDRVLDIHPRDIPILMLEDAEDGDTDGWSVIDIACGEGEPIANLDEGGARGRVIDLCGDSTSARYQYLGDSGTVWRSPLHRYLSWEMMPKGPVGMYVEVDTDQGLRLVRYVTVMPNPNYPNPHEAVDLGAGVQTGVWQSFVRDVAGDIVAQERVPLQFKGITRIFVRGGMSLDNMTASRNGALFGYAGTALSDEGSPLDRATVTMVHTETGASWTDVSDAEGKYSFGSLSHGLYTISIENDGIDEPIEVFIGQ